MNEQEIKLLRDLEGAGGVATSKQLGGYTPLGAKARVSCSQRGYVRYEGSGGSTGHWRLTEAGRAALDADQ